MSSTLSNSFRSGRKAGRFNAEVMLKRRKLLILLRVTGYKLQENEDPCVLPFSCPDFSVPEIVEGSKGSLSFILYPSALAFSLLSC